MSGATFVAGVLLAACAVAVIGIVIVGVRAAIRDRRAIR